MHTADYWRDYGATVIQELLKVPVGFYRRAKPFCMLQVSRIKGETERKKKPIPPTPKKKNPKNSVAECVKV